MLRPARLLPLAIALMVFVGTRAHATEPDTFSPIVSYQYQESLADSGITITSPVVSFQYQESLADSETTITSPVVSYQFYEWPGDENLTFQNSPAVSYYYSNGSPRILIQPIAMAVMVGQTATFSVTTDSLSPLSYQWNKNGVALANSHAASLVISNAQQDDSGRYSVTIQNVYGSVISAETGLFVYSQPTAPKPAIPTTVAATQTPSPAQLKKPGVVPSNAQLLSFGNPALVDKSIMTIVLTHGWNATAFDWPQAMANELRTRYKVNVLAWDWHENALLNPFDPASSASRTVAEGTQLGQALMDTLGPNYDKPIHFIGHSLGTIVNCTAADYIHGDRRPRGDSRSISERYLSERTHVTLFDEAELVTAVKGLHLPLDVILASAKILTGGANTDNNQLVKNFWSKVMPDRFAWADNYLSEVGLLNPRAVNVMLWASDELRNPIAAHGYAYNWYQLTIGNPLGSRMGHTWSFERNTLEPAKAQDRYFLQKQPELLLVPVDAEQAIALETSRIIAYPDLLKMRALNGAAKITYQAINAIGNATIQYAGNLIAGIGQTFSVPSGPPVYLGTAGSTPAFFAGTNSGNAGNLEASWDLHYNLQAGAPSRQQLKIPVRTMAVPGAALNAVYTIIPVHVPKEAVGVSFEYQITGGDSEENSFTMEAKYLEDGQWNGTPVIRVSDVHNQDVSLVFALNGANGPPSGVLGVRNMQFYIPPRPELTVEKTGDVAIAKWPISALDWTIETTTDLSDPNGWETVNQTPTDSDFFHTMTFDVSGINKAFFRLKK